MAKALTKSQIASEIAEKNSITKKQSVEILEQIAALAYKHAKDAFMGVEKYFLLAPRFGWNRFLPTPG